jgi:hypothetical protein
MSRTLRRNKKHLILDHVGAPDKCKRDGWWMGHCHYRDLPFEQAYARSVHRYTRDHHNGYYGIPRWYRRLHGSKDVRLRENQALHVHHHRDSWDAHIPETRYRSKGYHWF